MRWWLLFIKSITGGATRRCTDHYEIPLPSLLVLPSRDSGEWRKARSGQKPIKYRIKMCGSQRCCAQRNSIADG